MTGSRFLERRRLPPLTCTILYPDVTISDFQLPGDDPAGGISLAVTVSATSTSLLPRRCSLPLFLFRPSSRTRGARYDRVIRPPRFTANTHLPTARLVSRLERSSSTCITRTCTSGEQERSSAADRPSHPSCPQTCPDGAPNQLDVRCQLHQSRRPPAPLRRRPGGARRAFDRVLKLPERAAYDDSSSWAFRHAAERRQYCLASARYCNAHEQLAFGMLTSTSRPPGIQALTLNVALQSPTGRISPINGITIEALSLAFDPSAPYAPMSNSSQVSATFGLPFGFSLVRLRFASFATSLSPESTSRTSSSLPTSSPSSATGPPSQDSPRRSPRVRPRSSPRTPDSPPVASLWIFLCLL